VFLISLRVYRQLKSDISDDKTITFIAIAMLGTYLIISNFGDLRFHIITHNVLFILLGIVYSLAKQLTEIKNQTSQTTNILMARNRFTFPTFTGNGGRSHIYQKTHGIPALRSGKGGDASSTERTAIAPLAKEGGG